MKMARREQRVQTPPMGFQPGLNVGDPLAEHWLRQGTLRLRREIAWLWHQRGTREEEGGGALPPMIDAPSESLDLVRYEDERQAFFRDDSTAVYLTDLISRPISLGLTGKCPRGGFQWLVETLALKEADCFALALALGRVLDSAQGPVIAACQNDIGATQPTLALMQRLWGASEEVLRLLDPGHALVAHGILHPPPAHWDSPLQVAPVVARQLLFPEAGAPDALRAVEPPLAFVDRVGTPSGPAPDLELAMARLKTRAPGRLCILPIVGSPGAPRAATAARMSRAIEMPLVEVAGAPSSGTGFDALMVTAWLRGAAVYLPFGAIAASDNREDRLLHLARFPLVIFVGLEESDPVAHFPPQITLTRVRLTPLSYDQRLAHWRRELPSVWAGETGREALTECARRFRYEGDTIARIAGAVRALGRPPTPRDLYDACRADIDLGDLAQPVAPRFALEELMLPDRQATQIRGLVTAVGALTRVHHDWGTARAWNESGLSVLFSGPPGTGKTMAAEAIARAVDMPIFRIDLSQVVNKYIGETEKNLRRLFDAADAADVILFFDEADALFGKRTEVKDAHDRYANLEVSYLLERMERFKGLAVLATNRKKDLDEAFMRRLRYVVQFPLPGPEERLRIWRAVLPEGVDCSDLDVDFLAARIPLSGGHIRSAVFNACLQSAENEGPPALGTIAVVRALKDEFDKLNRAVTLDQFGPYSEHVKD